MNTGSVTPVPASAPSRERRSLTDRELHVLLRVASSWSNKDIAHELDVNPVTVTNTLRRVYEQLDVRDRIGAVVRAFERGILAVPGSDNTEAPVPEVGNGAGEDSEIHPDLERV